MRDVGLNPFNGWTIGLGLIAGAVAMRAATVTETVAATVIVLLATVPALLGGMGLPTCHPSFSFRLEVVERRRSSDGLKTSDREERNSTVHQGSHRLTEPNVPILGWEHGAWRIPRWSGPRRLGCD